MKKMNTHKKHAAVRDLSPFMDIPDKRAEMEREAREASNRIQEQTLADRRNRELVKQNRILATKTDKYLHAVDVVLEWTEKRDSNNYIGDRENLISCTIDYYFFNFEDRWDVARNLFEPFLNELKDAGCLNGWERQTLVGRSRYMFLGVDIGKLKEYRKNINTDDTQQGFKQNNQNLIDPDKTKWILDKDNSHKGYYMISPNEVLKFRGGRFGGIDELIKNSGREITGEQLILAIKKHTQNGHGDIRITQWKYELMTKTKFSKFFYLNYIKPFSYRLYLLKEEKT